jgi:sugar phosphate isomerase/epimerase
MKEIQFGVSPAYHISRFGDGFSPEQVASSLVEIKALGFQAFQLEVFHPETLSDWAQRGAALVAEAVEKTGLYPSQFVGHFLLHAFENPEALESGFGINEMSECLQIIKPFPGCRVITVAVPAFRMKETGKDIYKRFRDRFTEKLRAILDIAGTEGIKIGLEILPGSIVGGLQGLLRLIEETGSKNLGYNFDTGHAWVCREMVEAAPSMFAGRIFGTHLKDNDQKENLSLAPGRGTIPWDGVIDNLLSSGYQGSLDIEINCESDAVEKEYTEGLAFIKSRLQSIQGVNHD